jgi:hypothetical protein
VAETETYRGRVLLITVCFQGKPEHGRSVWDQIPCCLVVRCAGSETTQCPLVAVRLLHSAVDTTTVVRPCRMFTMCNILFSLFTRRKALDWHTTAMISKTHCQQICSLRTMDHGNNWGLCLGCSYRESLEPLLICYAKSCPEKSTTLIFLLGRNVTLCTWQWTQIIHQALYNRWGEHWVYIDQSWARCWSWSTGGPRNNSGWTASPSKKRIIYIILKRSK